MALSDLDRPEHIIAALKEFDRLEPSEFKRLYGLAPAVRYALIFQGKPYPAESIVRAAVALAHSLTDEAGQFTTDEHAAANKLTSLGFEVVKTERPLSPGRPYTVGEEYVRKRHIHATFGGQSQGGISTPAGAPFVFLFTGTSGTEYGYTDGLREDGSFLYTGEGQIGDMELRAGNRAIYEHEANGKSLLLFEALGKSKPYRFLGEFTYSGYREREAPDRNGNSRRTLQFILLPDTKSAVPTVDAGILDTAYEKFKATVLATSGVPFVSFGEGIVGEWENYKSEIRQIAVSILDFKNWKVSDIGKGKILRRAIEAIEIELSKELENNLVQWKPKHGPTSQEHLAMLEAERNKNVHAIHAIERSLFSLFCTDEPNEVAFRTLQNAIGGKYSVLAYFMFLKNADQYTPISTRGFDQGFEQLGLEFRTTKKASWENYTTYNALIRQTRDFLRNKPGLANTDLLDAHTFIWTMVKLPSEQSTEKPPEVSDFSADVVMMMNSVKKTVRRADGRVEQRRLKPKDLHLTEEELAALLNEMLSERAHTCAITGLPFHSISEGQYDVNYLPSLDRIDSSKHYERDNLQLVCRFINFWKSATSDTEFRTLIAAVRSTSSQF